MKPPVNLRGLDALRGVLALYVVAHHARWLLWAGQERWVAAAPHPAWANALALAGAGFRDGHAAVLAFFVLSGFFIHLRAAATLAAGGTPAVDAGRFYARRLHRLGPPYVFALGLTLALDLAGRHWFPALYAAQTGDRLLDGAFAHKGFAPDSILPALVLLPTSLGRDFGSNGPLWSLAFEVVYYALYPAWLALRRTAAGAWGSYAGLGLALAVAGPALARWGAFPGAALASWPLWLMGAALAEVLAGGSWRHLLPAGLPLVIGGIWKVDFRAGLIGAAVVLGVARLPMGICRWRWHCALERLGIASYTLYIGHFPILALLSAWMFQRYGERPFHPWLALAGVGLAVAVLRVAYEVCERPFLHARLRLGPPDGLALRADGVAAPASIPVQP